MISEKFGLSGGVWGWISEVNNDLADFGFVIGGIFVAAWIVSAMVYWLNGFEWITATIPAE